MVIKKLNTMFHKHSRVLFGAFTIIIIVSFLGFLTPGQFGCEGTGSGENTRVGTAFGEPVTYGDLIDLRRKLAVLSELGGRQTPDLPYEQLFYAYCPLLRAKQLGIVVSDKEVAAMIRNEALFFGKDRSFDLEKYTEIVQKLKNYGISESDLNEAFRLLILQQKLYAALMAGVTVTDAEAEELYMLVNTSFDVKAISFNTADFRKKVAIPKQDELQAYFRKNCKNYPIDGKVSGLVAVFPASGFRAEAQKLAKPQALEAFYKANSASFADKDGKVPEFSKVSKQVTEKFLELGCAELASERAHRFSAAAYDAVGAVKTPAEKEKAFRELAAKEKALIEEAGPVEFSSAKFGSVESAALVRSLAMLGSATPVGNAVAEQKGAYVGFLKSRVMPRQAEYKEVAGRVLQDYQQFQAQRLARECAEKSFASLQKIAEPAKRKAAFSVLKNGKMSEFSFSAVKAAPQNMESIVQGVFTLRPGEITPPAATPEGMALLLLLRRAAPDMKKFAQEKETYKFQALMQKQQRKQLEFQQQLMARCRWELDEKASAPQAL